MQTHTAILGGGIGGLTMANALQRVGIPFQLYEQSPELTEVGAGIGMSHGALQLLDMLGLGEERVAGARRCAASVSPTDDSTSGDGCPRTTAGSASTARNSSIS